MQNFFFFILKLGVEYRKYSTCKCIYYPFRRKKTKAPTDGWLQHTKKN